MSEPKIQTSDRLLWGASQIARVVQLSEPATSRLLRLGHIPATKLGARWVASTSRLERVLTGERSGGRNV
jgi:hypothetical protein